MGIDRILSFDPATDQCTHNKDSITWLLNVVFDGKFLRMIAEPTKDWVIKVVKLFYTYDLKFLAKVLLVACVLSAP